MDENPYQSPTTKPKMLPSIRRRHLHLIRGFIGIVLCLVAPAWIAFSLLKERLLQSRVLNTKDLSPLVGDRTGTISEYLLNEWHWGGISFLLMLASLPCLCIGVWLLRRPRTSGDHDHPV